MDHVESKSENTEFDQQIDQRDAVYKQKMKKCREGKQTKKTSLLLDGRTVCRDASQFKLVNSVMGTINEDELSWEEKLVIYRNRDEQQTKQTVIQNQNPTNIPEKNTTEVQMQEQDHSNISEIKPEGNQMQVEKETQPQRAEQNVETTNIEPRNIKKERPRRERRKSAYLKEYVPR
ncbi:Hypothetical predicted protein [Paramuricea clavata]|uniref:Uncharacterized protein n=1 Tax=Paramuricea clavata TaxID=317549 RepID=A0A7D9E9P9_PARCT|nr:Hypothetical predicted protein [Paramuricea clavata]